MSLGERGRLTLYQKVGWAAGDLGVASYVGATMAFLLFYLTEAKGVPAALAGVAVLIPRLIDVVADPLIGIWSDRTRHSLGRRRPWLLYGSVVFGLGFWLMFALPGEGAAIVPVFMLVYTLAGFAYSAYAVPHNAMAAELTDDARERAGLMGYKMLAARFGIVVVTVLGSQIFTSTTDLRSGFALFGMVFGLFVTATGLVSFVATREAPQTVDGKSHQSILKDLTELRHNQPLKVLLAAFLLQNAAIGAGATAALYYITLYIGLPASTAAILLATIGIVATMATPIWVLVVRRLGKRPTWHLSMAMTGTVSFAVFFLVEPGAATALAIFMVVQGMGDAGTQLAPNAMAPDTVEVTEESTGGGRREGVVAGAFYATLKLGMAIGGFLSSLVFALFGFSSGVGAELQSAEAVFGVKVAYTLLPLGLWGAAALVLTRYRLDEASHARLTLKLETRQHQGKVS